MHVFTSQRQQEHEPAPAMGRSSVGHLNSIIASVCDRTIDHLRDVAFRQEVVTIRDRMSEPLRVAVAGRVSTGKSTLVNGLLGLRIAPTGAGETTRIVTFYRYAETDRAVVTLRDGREIRLAFDEHRALPEEVGYAWTDVDHLDVWLYSDVLRRFTVIDTPGLSSLGEEGAERAERLLTDRSTAGAAAADAVIYVLTRDAQEADDEILKTFRESSRGPRSSSANSIVVINKIDKLAVGGGDALELAADLVARVRSEIGDVVADVVPLVGLLAETVETGGITEEQSSWLRALAADQAWDRSETLLSVRRFAESAELPLSEPARLTLLRRLDLYGLRRALNRMGSTKSGAVDLVSTLGDASGFNPLVQRLAELFGDRAEILKADAALASLRTLVQEHRPSTDAELLEREIHIAGDELAQSSDAQRLREMALAQDLAAGNLVLPQAFGKSATQMISASAPAGKVGLAKDAAHAKVEAAAIGLALEWRAFGNAPARTETERSAAHTMALAFAQLLEEVQTKATS